jgi:hypothetical protein
MILEQIKLLWWKIVLCTYIYIDVKIVINNFQLKEIILNPFVKTIILWQATTSYMLQINFTFWPLNLFQIIQKNCMQWILQHYYNFFCTLYHTNVLKYYMIILQEHNYSNKGANMLLGLN